MKESFTCVLTKIARQKYKGNANKSGKLLSMNISKATLSAIRTV